MRDWVFLFTFLRCFSARRLLTRFTCCKLRFLARVCSSPRYLRSFSRQNPPHLEHEMETSYSSTFSSSSSHSRSSSYEASRKMRATSEVWNGQSWGILYIWLFSGLRQVLRLHENWPEETPARILHSRTNLHHRQLLPAVGSPLLPPPHRSLYRYRTTGSTETGSCHVSYLARPLYFYDVPSRYGFSKYIGELGWETECYSCFVADLLQSENFKTSSDFQTSSKVKLLYPPSFRASSNRTNEFMTWSQRYFSTWISISCTKS